MRCVSSVFDRINMQFGFRTYSGCTSQYIGEFWEDCRGGYSARGSRIDCRRGDSEASYYEVTQGKSEIYGFNGELNMCADITESV